MPSSVWSGHLTFGLISMPVRLFSGARSQSISFNMLHRPDKSRLKQQYVCLADGQVVDRNEIVKGYEFRKDEYIIIEPDEIKKIEPQTAKTMEILEFVKASEVDPVYFESSYYMMPEEAGRRPYALLTKALEESDYVAIAKITMEVIQRVDGLLSSLKDAETGQRGFLLTSRESYLQPFNDARASLPGQIQQLRNLTFDNPQQQARLLLPPSPPCRARPSPPIG